MTPPLGQLRYLYVASADVARDLEYFRERLGAGLVWDATAFGARVAAVKVAAGPLVLLADHRRPPSVMPVFAVPDLRSTARELRGRGWRPTAGPFEIPDGPCYTFADPSGNEYALFGDERPNALAAKRGRRSRKGP